MKTYKRRMQSLLSIIFICDLCGFFFLTFKGSIDPGFSLGHKYKFAVVAVFHHYF